MADRSGTPRFTLRHFRDSAPLRAEAARIGLAPLGLDFARLLAACLCEDVQNALLRRLELSPYSSIDDRLVAALRHEGWSIAGADDKKLADCWVERIEFVPGAAGGSLRAGPSYRDRQHVDLLLTTWERETLRAAPPALTDRLAASLAAHARRFAVEPAPDPDAFEAAADERRLELEAERMLRRALQPSLAALAPDDLHRLAILDALDNGADLDAALRRYGDASMRAALARYQERDVPTAARERLEVWLDQVRRAIWAPTRTPDGRIAASDRVEEPLVAFRVVPHRAASGRRTAQPFAPPPRAARLTLLPVAPRGYGGVAA